MHGKVSSFIFNLPSIFPASSILLLLATRVIVVTGSVARQNLRFRLRAPIFDAFLVNDGLQTPSGFTRKFTLIELKLLHGRGWRILHPNIRHLRFCERNVFGVTNRPRTVSSSIGCEIRTELDQVWDICPGIIVFFHRLQIPIPEGELFICLLPIREIRHCLEWRMEALCSHSFPTTAGSPPERCLR